MHDSCRFSINELRILHLDMPRPKPGESSGETLCCMWTRVLAWIFFRGVAYLSFGGVGELSGHMG